MSSILRPDSEGHYSPSALELDRAARRRFSPGAHPLDELAGNMAVEETRRRFFQRGAQGIGALALASLLGDKARASTTPASIGGLPGFPHFAPKAKRCIYLHL